jgi:NAD(P)-dependent dehydrogenase (short-subunit alcohol dehydrogenase family)
MSSSVPIDQLPALGSALGLTGRSVVVTGASSGIGADVALGLARAGMKVTGVGRRAEPLDQLAKTATAEGLSFLAQIADVADEAQVEGVMEATVAEFGGLDAVVANAGIAHVAPALDHPADAFRNVLDTNVTGAFLTARSAARRMGRGGSVVFTSSSFAKRGFTDWAAYNASKAAIGNLVETLAKEWAPQGIRVNAMAPAATVTDVNRALFENEEFTASVVATIPGGRIMQTEEFVLPIAFLLSPHNELLLGTTLFVDGGQSL